MARLYGARVLDFAELTGEKSLAGVKFAQTFDPATGMPTGTVVYYLACGNSNAALEIPTMESFEDIEKRAIKALVELRAFEDNRLRDIAELEKLASL
jgi:hypothetical protein